MKIRHALWLLLAAGAFYVGLCVEANRVQSTCEDENAPTVLNGTAYVCLTAHDWRVIVGQLKSRGA